MTRPVITRTLGRQTEPPITKQRWAEFVNNREAAKRGSWSDGGHWLGAGPGPNAFDTVKAYNKSALILIWPSDECVQKFRLQSAKIGERVGYGADIIAAVLTLGRSWGAGLGAGLAASWLLNQAGGIQVHRGWTYKSENSVTMVVSAHRSYKSEWKFSRVQTLTDHTGTKKDSKTHNDTRDLDGCPDDILFQILAGLQNREGATTTISCPDASVLLAAG